MGNAYLVERKEIMLNSKATLILEKKCDDFYRKFVEKMKSYRVFLDNWIIHKEVLSEATSTEKENNFDCDDSQFKYWENLAKDGKELVYVDGEANGELKLKLKQLQMTLYALESGSGQQWLIEAYKACINNNDIEVKISEKKVNKLYKRLFQYFPAPIL